MFRPNFTSGLLQVITAFHSCCLSHHVFDLVNLRTAWVGFETAIFWQCSPATVETQRLYLLRHGPRRAIKDGFFGLINPYLVFHSRVRTEFLYLSLIGIILRWGFLIWELILFFIYCRLFLYIYCRLSILIRGRGKITWRRPEMKFGRNVVKEETT